MTTATQTQSFFDGQVARILAMVLAVLIGGFVYLTWPGEIKNLFAGNPPAIPMMTKAVPVGEPNADLAACLTQRVGDVERMKEEGILSDAQYASFKSRAGDLCRVQNPG